LPIESAWRRQIAMGVDWTYTLCFTDAGEKDRQTFAGRILWLMKATSFPDTS